MTVKNFNVGPRTIGVGQPVFIIAEIGVNHDGDEATCARLIDAAAAAGADAAKLQIVDADESYVKGSLSHTTFKDRGLSVDAIMALCAHAKSRGIILFATPGDFASLEILQKAAMPAIKISSGLLSNLPLIKRAGASGLPMIFSSGMSQLGDVAAALDTARGAGAQDLAILQCTSIYPTPPGQVNLRVISQFESEFGIIAGYSDHSLGPLACVAATAAGAHILEKHITFDQSLAGADHALSATPGEFAQMVDQVRLVELMLGNETKMPTTQEAENKKGLLRCIVARAPIKAGDILDEQTIGLKRPLPGARGMDAHMYEAVLGRRANKDMDVDQPINDNDLEPLI